MKLFFNIPYLKDIFTFLGVPLIILFIVFFFSIGIYYFKTKKKDEKYYYNMKFYSLLFAVVVCAFLLAISIAFSINFVKDMYFDNLLMQYKVLYIFISLFPVFPLVFLIMYMVLFYKSHKQKKYSYVTDNVLVIDKDGKEKYVEIEVI